MSIQSLNFLPVKILFYSFYARCKLVLTLSRLSFIKNLNFLSSHIFLSFVLFMAAFSLTFSNNVELKLAKFLQLIGTIKRTNFKKRENGNHFEIIQHFSFTYIFVWVRKLDFDSLTGTEN
jgi:hypothetical protein